LTFCHVQDVHIQEEASVVFNRAKQVAVLAFLKQGIKVFDEIRSLFRENAKEAKHLFVSLDFRLFHNPQFQETNKISLPHFAK
jgi:1-deoxy-D-xylulose 5-phosphate reductoisomerase